MVFLGSSQWIEMINSQATFEGKKKIVSCLILQGHCYLLSSLA